jgi:hypothetical protein
VKLDRMEEVIRYSSEEPPGGVGIVVIGAVEPEHVQKC